jgi:peroxiredoxin
MKLLTIPIFLLGFLLTVCAVTPSTIMAQTPAPALLAPGSISPDFTLPDLDGIHHSLGQYLADGKIVVLEWFNPDCPFVMKHHKNNRTMSETYARSKDHGIVWLAINSGAPGLQGHGMERNQRAHKEYRMQYPLLLDPTGRVGKQYGARTSPHMFVILPDGKVAYNGAIDDDRSVHQLGKTNHVMEALEAVAAGKTVTTAETRPYGCSVKYAD